MRKADGSLPEILSHGIDINARIGAYPILIKHVKRRAVFFGERDGVYARDGEMAFFIDRKIGMQHGILLLLRFE